MLGIDGSGDAHSYPSGCLSGPRSAGFVGFYLFGARYDAAATIAARTVLLTSATSFVTLVVVLARIGA